jgi:hypothetical protein
VISNAGPSLAFERPGSLAEGRLSGWVRSPLSHRVTGVFRVCVSNGAAERVVDLKGFRHTGAFTHWMGLDPTDTPMLLRDVGTDDIYALTLEQK